MNVYFATDLVLNFYTGYYDGDDMLEMRKPKIAQNYMKFWFWIDCVSCFPMDYVQLMFDESTGASNLKLLKVRKRPQISLRVAARCVLPAGCCLLLAPCCYRSSDLLFAIVNPSNLSR